MRKEFEINGCVEVAMELSEDEFWYKFIDFIEANNWYFGGGIKEIVDGFYINEDGTKEHVLDSDLKELVLQGNNEKALNLYMELTGSGEKEAKEYIASLSRNLWGNNFRKFIEFLERLERYKIYYKLDKIRDGYILVEIAVPGERWEVEFSLNGDVVAERFKSFEDVGDEKMLEYLFEHFSD